MGDQVDVLTFGEIKEIVQELTNLFEVASFSTEYRYLIIAYDPTVRHPVGIDPRPDIERILDSIARESSVLHDRKQTRWRGPTFGRNGRRHGSRSSICTGGNAACLKSD